MNKSWKHITVTWQRFRRFLMQTARQQTLKPIEPGKYDTDDNVFANDIQHFDQSESISNTCAVETGDSNVTPDSPDMCDNDIQDDQNDVECDDERVTLANLIANLKLDVDENKKIQKQLKKANATLTQELTECKYILAETSRTQGNLIVFGTSNINVVCATCENCVFNANHDARVSKFLKDVNARTKKPNRVPISTENPKKKTIKAWKCDSTTNGHQADTWVPKPKGNGFKEITRSKGIYYIEGLNHNLFLWTNSCDYRLEVNIQKSRVLVWVRDLQGNDLLTGNRGTDLYTISLQETTSSTPICLMAKASPTQAWLWHRRLSHLNFDYINFLSKKDVMIGLPKTKNISVMLHSIHSNDGNASSANIKQALCQVPRDRPTYAATGTIWHNGDHGSYIHETRPNGDALRKCILTVPLYSNNVQHQLFQATEDSPENPAKTTVETMKSTQPVDCMSDSFKKCGKPSDSTKREVNELRAERIAKNANPLALDPEQAQKDKDMQKNLALIAKYFKKLYKPTNNNLRTSSNTRNKNVDTTPRYKNDNQTGQFGNQRAINVVGARETVGSPVVQQSGIQCFNCKEFGHYAKECRKPKRVRDSTYHKEKMLLCKQAEKGVQLQAEQSDWLADTDEEIDEQELEAHYSYMAKIQEVPNADSGTDAEPLEQNDQHDVECDDERVALANLIANLKLDVDDNKKIQKQLKKANATLTQELTECKSILAETSRTLGESNIVSGG
ncbi:retrovirus-related pol polyprotein from transposon TNT 1-94 [Tanacetum coccineum]